MKALLKVLVFGALLGICASSASATPIDPGVIIRDPVGCPGNNCVSITGLTFSFSVPSSGFGVLHFLNASGVTWTSLILTEVGVAALNVTCSSNAFSCSVVSFGQSGAKIILTATGAFTGIPNGNSFEVILGCLNGGCPHWPGGLVFEAVANAVPEPTTMLLLLTGVGAVFTRKKLRAKTPV